MLAELEDSTWKADSAAEELGDLGRDGGPAHARRAPTAPGMRGPADWGRTPPTTRRRRTRPDNGRGRRRPRRPGRDRTATAPPCPMAPARRPRSQSAASFRFIVLPTPPSMYRRSPIVTGGHAPGTAQLAATASISSTPDFRSNATSSPVPMSIAVMRRSRSGQSCDGNRWAITSRRTASDTVAVVSQPHRCGRSFCALVASGSESASRNSSVMSSMSTLGLISFDVPLICRSYSSSRPRPLPSCAATADPAEVPTSTSESSSVRAASAASSSMPRRMPISQAMPASPPPASTRPRFDVTDESLPGGQ